MMGGRKGRWLVIVLLVAACSPSGSRRLTPEERNLVDSWLVCEECVDGELDSVLALARRKAQPTRDTLAADLLAGPSASRRDHVGKQVLASYLKLRAYATSRHGEPIALSQDEYVHHFFGNFVALYRKRALLALAKVGGPGAGPALDSAANGQARTPGDSLRPDVKAAAKFARDSILGGAPTVRGTLDSAP